MFFFPHNVTIQPNPTRHFRYNRSWGILSDNGKKKCNAIISHTSLSQIGMGQTCRTKIPVFGMNIVLLSGRLHLRLLQQPRSSTLHLIRAVTTYRIPSQVCAAYLFTGHHRKINSPYGYTPIPPRYAPKRQNTSTTNGASNWEYHMY